MSVRPSRGTTTQKRTLVLAGIALVIGGTVLFARHLYDWTRPAGGEVDPPPVHRAIAMTLSRPLQLLEWRVYDFVSSFGIKTPPDPDVVVVGIDEACLALENSSAFPEDIDASRPLQLMNRGLPWSREVYQHVIDRLIGAGARTVVIDLMFPAPVASDPEGDHLFRDSLDRHRDRVIVAADVIERAVEIREDDALGKQRDFIQFPFDGLIEQKRPVDERIGFVTYWAEGDGVIRKAKFRWSDDARLPEKAVPSFVAAALRSQGLSDRVPDDFEAHYVRFGDSTNYLPVSLHEIFVPAIWESNHGSGKRFAGKTIFLGNVARQGQDYHTTSVGRIAGVQVHAHVFAAAKAGQLLHGVPSWGSPLLIAAAAALAWLLIARCRRPVLATTLIFAGLGLGVVGQMLLFNHAAVVVNASTPMLTFGLIGFWGVSYNFLLEYRQKLALKRSVMRFHSPDVAEQIVEHPESYYSIRQGAARSIVVLFSDIRGYTSMSEQLTAQEMVAQLNEYFERMVSIVFQRKGAVDKFIGDAMMAVWGRFRDGPSEADLEDDACRAVEAALAMRDAVVQLNAGWKERNITQLTIGIGIHQGEAVVGEIGSHERAELTAIGDCVNLSSRLEGATKEYGLDLLISDTVQRRVAKRFICRTADLVRVKGKRKPVEVFAVLGPRESPPPSGLDHFEMAMRCYRQGDFAEARQLFHQAAGGGLDDEMTQTFIKRCSELLATPSEDWDGVYTMTKK